MPNASDIVFIILASIAAFLLIKVALENYRLREEKLELQTQAKKDEIHIRNLTRLNKLKETTIRRQGRRLIETRDALEDLNDQLHNVYEAHRLLKISYDNAINNLAVVLREPPTVVSLFEGDIDFHYTPQGEPEWSRDSSSQQLSPELTSPAPATESPTPTTSEDESRNVIELPSRR